MNTSPEFIAELGTADMFVSHLQRLTTKRLGELARRVEETRATTTAGDVEWWRATAAVSRRLRQLHRSHAAAVVALRASEAVLGAPGAAELPRRGCPWARAAGDVGRALVANGPPFALDVFTSGWEDVVGTPSSPPGPSAA